MRQVSEKERRIQKSVSLPAHMVRAFQERAKRERRPFSTYVVEGLEYLLDSSGKGRPEVCDDQR